MSLKLQQLYNSLTSEQIKAFEELLDEDQLAILKSSSETLEYIKQLSCSYKTKLALSTIYENHKDLLSLEEWNEEFDLFIRDVNEEELEYIMCQIKVDDSNIWTLIPLAKMNDIHEYIDDHIRKGIRDQENYPQDCSLTDLLYDRIALYKVDKDQCIPCELKVGLSLTVMYDDFKVKTDLEE